MSAHLKPLPLVKIDASGVKSIRSRESDLRWMAIADLVIDTRYQRDVGMAGKSHIERIATAFDWSKFAPLVVASYDGVFAIIDGQHRATAAKARGVAAVPAYVLVMTAAEAASAFAAINGNVSPISSLHVFKAALAAGEGWAGNLQRIAGAAGVTILTYPKPKRLIKAGETMAVAALRDCLRLYGEAALLAGLDAVTSTRHNEPGGLNQTIIKALSAAAASSRRADFAAAVGRIDLMRLDRDSFGGAPEAGISRSAWLTQAVLDEIKTAGKASS